MTPKPGDMLFAHTNDLGGRIIRAALHSPEGNHTAIFINETTVVEARPSGAGYQNAQGYTDSWVSTYDLTDEQRQRIVATTVGLVGTPYSWVDIAALSLYIVTGWHVPHVVQARIENNHKLICSQLDDLVWQSAGVHLFDDGRLPGAVTPTDLFHLSMLGWVRPPWFSR